MKILNAFLCGLLLVVGLITYSQSRLIKAQSHALQADEGVIKQLEQLRVQNSNTLKAAMDRITAMQMASSIKLSLVTDLPSRSMPFALPVFDYDLESGGYRYNVMAVNTKKTSEEDVVNVCAAFGYYKVGDVKTLPVEFKQEKLSEKFSTVSDLLSQGQSTTFIYFKKRISGG